MIVGVRQQGADGNGGRNFQTGIKRPAPEEGSGISGGEGPGGGREGVVFAARRDPVVVRRAWEKACDFHREIRPIRAAWWGESDGK